MTASIVGPVCETGDTFARDRVIDKVAAGDLAVFRTAGAYGATMASTYNSRSLVPEVLVDGDRYIVVARPGHPARRASPLSAPELMRLPLASAGLTPDFQAWLGEADALHTQNLEAFLSDDYDLIKRMAVEADFIARGPQFVFEHELAQGELVELALDSDFQYECWMLTTKALWRSPVVKAIADLARAR